MSEWFGVSLPSINQSSNAGSELLLSSLWRERKDREERNGGNKKYWNELPYICEEGKDGALIACEGEWEGTKNERIFAPIDPSIHPKHHEYIVPKIVKGRSLIPFSYPQTLPACADEEEAGETCQENRYLCGNRGCSGTRLHDFRVATAVIVGTGLCNS